MNRLKYALIIALCICAVGSPFITKRFADTNLWNVQQVLNAQSLQLTNLITETTRLSNIVHRVQNSNALSQADAAELAHLRTEFAKLQASVNQTDEIQRNVIRLREHLADAAAEEEYGPQKDNALISDELPLRRGRAARLKQWLENTPQEKSPELQYVKDSQWESKLERPLISDDDFQSAASLLRFTGAIKFADQAYRAVRDYAKANNGQFPQDVFDLKPYLPSTIQNVDLLLKNYAVIPTSSLPQQFTAEFGSDWVISQVAPVNIHDTRVVIGRKTWVAGVDWHR
jgi:hypothetical protein